MFMSSLWLNFPMQYDYPCYNYTKNNYNIINGDDYMSNKNVLTKKFNELKNTITGEVIKLNGTITFKIESDEHGFYYINNEYNIYTYGETQLEAENNILEEFMIVYDSYALENDEKLDEKAKKLKYLLLNIYGGNGA